MNPLETLSKYDIPLHSYIAAVQSLSDIELTPEQYRDRIKELTGKECKAKDEYVRTHYHYLVQETVRRSMNTDIIDMDSIFELSTRRAEEYCRTNPWTFVKDEAQKIQKLDSEGNVKPKKGAKKQQAIDLYNKMVEENNGEFPSRQDAIKRFVDEVGMTKAGASTYVANCKKHFGKSW